MRAVDVDLDEVVRPADELVDDRLLLLVDLVVTLSYMTSGGMFEANPLVRWLVDSTQSAWVIVGWKVLSVASCATLLYGVRYHRITEYAAWALVAVLIWLTVQWILYANAAATLDPATLARLGPKLTVLD